MVYWGCTWPSTNICYSKTLLCVTCVGKLAVVLLYVYHLYSIGGTHIHTSLYSRLESRTRMRQPFLVSLCRVIPIGPAHTERRPLLTLRIPKQHVVVPHALPPTRDRKRRLVPNAQHLVRRIPHPITDLALFHWMRTQVRTPFVCQIGLVVYVVNVVRMTVWKKGIRVKYFDHLQFKLICRI